MLVRSDMLISDVLINCPGAADVFEKHGLGCAACLAANVESLSAVAVAHDVSLDALLDDLNQTASSSDVTRPRKESV